ncbi:chromate ion transporter [Mollisia scopiformis]|uniref:Chromate ion transporter n=1 Tax=Mollisia scopiformis TaxID=149040 RepID=A0A194X4P5_MOLSC|nr:chromate ion transporter [Mollisia scopiformis]KUJ15141.1 chromate ion transporter [Mollisia scopiformis]
MAITSKWNPSRVAKSVWEVLEQGWYLGFTAFGGPPVHFKIFHDKYVNKLGWIAEQMYQELFAVCQAFSGPGSTKMYYCLNLIHFGFLPAVLALIIWTLPGALGMYGFAVGVSHIGESLPRQAYALLSGLNAAVVGIIALAAVQLAQKAITDKMTRILVVLGACAGLLYNALWYFPLLMMLAGCTSVIFDYRVLHPAAKWITSLRRKRKQTNPEDQDLELPTNVKSEQDKPAASSKPATAATAESKSDNQPSATVALETVPEPRIIPAARTLNISWQFGSFVLVNFLLLFIAIMVLRGTLPLKPLLFNLFSNMFLAGTIISGGGPVVIPLLREYVVSEGWVSPRDFLLGLAIVQAFPGPNFNFAVFLGALTAVFGGYNAAAGVLLGYLGIFLPGIITVHGTMGIWSAIRGKRWVKSALRGINAAAVGLIYTAVYRLWQIGYVDEGFEAGKSLGDDPWWVVVAVTSYVGGMWFNVNAPVAIVLGATMGLIRYGVVVK